MLKQTSPTAWPAAPKPDAFEHGAVGQHQEGGGGGLRPAVGVLFVRSCAQYIVPGVSVVKELSGDRLDPNPREDTVLRDDINEAVKTAMKSQDKLRLSTLRMVNAAIKNADIEARGRQPRARSPMPISSASCRS